MRTIDGMELLLQILLYTALTVIGVSALTLAVLWRTLRRRLRVHPKTASVAPLLWNLPLSRAARTHRRLRTAAQAALRVSATAAPSPNSRPKNRRRDASEFDSLAESIAQEGVRIERDLVNAARTPRAHRNRALTQPVRDVERLEATVAELVATTSHWHEAIEQPSRQDPLDDIQERLTTLRHASEGVRDAERRHIPSLSTTPMPIDGPTAAAVVDPAVPQSLPTETVTEIEG